MQIIMTTSTNPGVAATIALMLASVVGWWSYSRWRAGHVILSSDGPPLSAQVLAESGDGLPGSWVWKVR